MELEKANKNVKICRAHRLGKVKYPFIKTRYILCAHFFATLQHDKDKILAKARKVKGAAVTIFR